IRIGIGVPLSGNSASLGAEMKQAIELALDERNTAGGIAGAAAAAVVAEDGGDPQQGESLARELCTDSAILGIVGHYNSDVTLAASPIYREAELAMITPIASNPAVTDNGLPMSFASPTVTTRPARRSPSTSSTLSANAGPSS